VAALEISECFFAPARELDSFEGNPVKRSRPIENSIAAVGYSSFHYIPTRYSDFY